MRFSTPASLIAASLPIGAIVLAAGAAPPKKAAPAPAVAHPASGPTFEKNISPLYAKYCGTCHAGKEAPGEIDLTKDKTFSSALGNRKRWDKAILTLDAGNMPPPDMPQPTPAERALMVGGFQALLTKEDCKLNDPGRVTMRRLNRAEYDGTVRDLLGINQRFSDKFPSDDVGYGFDNIGDVLSISPLLTEKYLAAAERAAKVAIQAAENGTVSNKIPGADFQGGGAPNDGGPGRMLSSTGEAYFDYDFKTPGEYVIVASAWAQQAGPENAKLAIRFGGPEQQEFEISAKGGESQQVKMQVTVAAPGKKRIGIDFTNDYYDVTNADKKLRGDRNLVVESVEVRPVNGAGGLPTSHTRLITTRPDENSPEAWDKASKVVLTPFLKRAFRRPASPEEVARYSRIARLALENRQTFERGIQLAVTAALVSPHFLYRVETDPKPDDKNFRRKLNDYELATRLSYFLWSSMPDDRLLSLAGQGKLSDTTVLLAEARRMLRDPKSRALADNFAGQWLQLRKLTVVQPDTGRFPTFDDGLRAAMKAETETFFTYVVQQDRPVLDFLSADYSFLNEKLAKHYGVPGVTGAELKKVSLAGTERGGILTQAAVLTLTSNPGRTSPVKRGKWVMENLLGTPPPPPPPNVPALDKPANQVEEKTMTVRQRLEDHRKNPACASCHRQMDDIGFSLEHFDAIGAWREKDGINALDCHGQLADGTKFDGATDFRRVLLSRKAQFTRTLTEKLLTYAIGRGIDPTDHCNIDAMAQKVSAADYKFSAVVSAIVQSPPFRERRGDESGITKVTK